MKNLILKIKGLIKVILPWIKYGIKEYNELKAFIKLQKENKKK